MEELALTNLLAVVAIAFAAPLALGLAPGLRLPAVVLELALGIAVGPHGLGWVEVDQAVEVVALLGLAMLLFLAGLEVDFGRLQGRVLRLALVSFAVSFALGLGAGLALHAAGETDSPVLVAVVLSATSLGVVIPVLKDAGLAATRLGQLVIAAASIADVATILLLSVLFSAEASGIGAQLALIGAFAALCGTLAVAVLVAERSRRLGAAIVRLQDTTAQIRVRGAFLLVVALGALAAELGLEVILGAFVAGALLSVLDHDRAMTHPALRGKLEAVGFGVFVPVFFVASGLRFDLGALGESAALVPLLLLALLLVRGVPALLYGGSLRVRAGAGLLQATSLPFIIAATAIGRELELLSEAAAAGLVAAGLISVLLFPLLAQYALDDAQDALEGAPAQA